MSDCGRHALTVIVFIGSVFSPYYAWSGRKDPSNHVAVNVALYGAGGRWAMTERGRRQGRQASHGFSVGRSGIAIEGGKVVVTVDERCAPIPKRVKGRIVLTPAAISSAIFAIDRAGEHLWRPIAPAAPITVEMEAPALRWAGVGYIDMNWGVRALEDTFLFWDWMRVDLDGGRSAVLYDTTEREGPGRRLALLSRADGSIEEINSPAHHPLPRTLWRMRRGAWSEDGPAVVRRTLEDAPFYVRTELTARIMGAPRTAIQESLDLTRFRSPVVKAMLPFRMPRVPFG